LGRVPGDGELIGRKFEGPGDVEKVCFVSPFIFLFLVFPPTSSLRLLPQIAFFPLTPTLSLLHVAPPLLYFDSCPELTHTLQARSLVLRSSGVHRTKLLAKSFAEKAKEVLEELPESVAKAGLVALTERVVGRRS
jgi:hypothetical protein